MLAPESKSDNASERYASAYDNVTLDHDPFVVGLKERLPAELRESFTPQQLDALRNAFATRSWARHKFDWRGTFNLWSNQYEIILVAPRIEGSAPIELVPGPRAGRKSIA